VKYNVIFCRSWRDGQKLVQKELGKMPKVKEDDKDNIGKYIYINIS
jgi:hypothetical protein